MPQNLPRSPQFHEIPATAGETSAVLPAVPADSTRWPFRHSFTPAPSSSITPATSCPGRAVRNGGKKAFLRDHIAVTDSTGLDADSHVSAPGCGISRSTISKSAPA